MDFKIFKCPLVLKQMLDCYVADLNHFRCCHISTSSQRSTDWNHVWISLVKSVG